MSDFGTAKGRDFGIPVVINFWLFGVLGFR